MCVGIAGLSPILPHEILLLMAQCFLAECPERTPPRLLNIIDLQMLSTGYGRLSKEQARRKTQYDQFSFNTLNIYRLRLSKTSL